jgi:HlyD family secretion protein
VLPVRKPLIKILKLTLRLAIIAGLGVAGWYAYQYYVPQEVDDPLGELPTAVTEVRDITVSVQATGVLQPVKVVEIKSKASGEILEMPVEMGDYVNAGDLIAQIDTAIIDQELKQNEADYESAKVRLEIAENQYRRARELHAQDLISENDLESSQQNFTNAEAQMLRSEASLDLAKERLADATVRAPSNGVIINKTVEEGQIIASSTNNVSGGTTLVMMADLSQLEIRTLVDEIDIGQVKPGMEVESTVEAFADEEFGGQVIKIEPQAVVQQSVTTFPVLSRIDNSDGKLLPGMNADVAIIIHRKPGVLAIPNEAVRTPTDAMEVKRMLGLVADTGEAGDGEGAAGRSFESGGRQGRGGSGRGAGLGRQAGGQDGASGMQPSRPDGSRGGSRDSGGEGRGDFAGEGLADGDEMFGRSARRDETVDMDPFGIQGRREPAVVFLFDAGGQLTTKEIVAGVRDWEYTEVLEGLSAGETLLLLPSTSLLRSQDRLRQWAQGRAGAIPGMGGPGGGRPPGMGGGGGRGGGRGGR